MNNAHSHSREVALAVSLLRFDPLLTVIFAQGIIYLRVKTWRDLRLSHTTPVKALAHARLGCVAMSPLLRAHPIGQRVGLVRDCVEVVATTWCRLLIE